MKITIEHEGHKITVEDETIVDICDAIDLLAVSYTHLSKQYWRSAQFALQRFSRK